MTDMTRTFKQSEEFLKNAERFIPLGSQTFSKSKAQFPFGVSPYFIEKGQGATVWDIDGNQYTDFINGLASVTLGYQDPDVDAAVKAQMKNGVSFSLPHRLESEVAELIVEMVPCAEMVRFGKNGSDATAGAIRLARAYTGKDHVLVCGYHGWQDWYIGTTSRDKGIPAATKALSHTFQYNDIESLRRLFDQFHHQVAAVIMEPMNCELPAAGFLEAVKDLTHQNNAVLIFDEVITGFRFANGGAQAHFGVTPDLATFGKGLANGYPLSAVAGKKEIMQLMEEIFFSFTFGGETLSLAAAKAVLQKLLAENVLEKISARGERLASGIKSIIKSLNMSDILSVSGHPSWTFLNMKETDQMPQAVLKTFYLQEMFQRGFLSLGTHNLSYAHTNGDIDGLLVAYKEIFSELKSHIESGTLKEQLRCEVLPSLFAVRGKSGKLENVE